jgi:hypothetical protein
MQELWIVVNCYYVDTTSPEDCLAIDDDHPWEIYHDYVEALREAAMDRVADGNRVDVHMVVCRRASGDYRIIGVDGWISLSAIGNARELWYQLNHALTIVKPEIEARLGTTTI